MRRLTIAGALLTCALAAAPMAAQADEYRTDFEAPAFGAGPIDDQGGWESVLPASDANVVVNGPAAQAAALGGQSLQLSNATVDGAIRQIGSPALTEPAGETSAVGASGTRHVLFDAGFVFAAFDFEAQPGLSLHVSPDDGNGQRTTAVQIRDLPDGLQVLALDPTDNGPGASAGWEYVPLVSGLDRSVPHVLWFEIDYADGPSNDVVRVYVDGELVHTTVTWEQYYRHDPEQAGMGNAVPIANSLMFQARSVWDGAVPTLAGEGLLVDDVIVASGTPAPPEPPPVDPPAGPTPPSPPAPVDPPKPTDERPPTLRVGGKGASNGTIRQGGFARHKKAIGLALKCNERCTVKARGGLSLKVKGKRIKLEVVKRTLEPGARAKLSLRLSPSARKAVRRALRRGKVVKAKVVLRVRDAAGNVRLVRRTIRLRP